MPYAKEKQKIYQRMRYLTDKKNIPVSSAVKMMKKAEFDEPRPMNRMEMIENFGKSKLGIHTSDATQKDRLKEKKIGFLEDLLELEDDEYVKSKIERFIEYYEEQNDETSDNE